MSSNSTAEPTTSNTRGSRLTWTPAALASRISSVTPAGLVEGGGDDDAIDAQLLDDLPHALRTVETIDLVALERQRRRHDSTRAAARELGANPVRQRRVTDHEATLAGGRASGEPPRGNARDHDRKEADQPQRGNLGASDM